MQSISVSFDITKVVDFLRKDVDISRIQGGASRDLCIFRCSLCKV